jgi:DNA-binding NarL/FixJ family response regulator
VITVDDHPVVRRGLKQIIAAEQDMQVKFVGEICLLFCLLYANISHVQGCILEIRPQGIESHAA